MECGTSDGMRSPCGLEIAERPSVEESPPLSSLNVSDAKQESLSNIMRDGINNVDIK